MNTIKTILNMFGLIINIVSRGSAFILAVIMLTNKEYTPDRWFIICLLFLIALAGSTMKITYQNNKQLNSSTDM